MNDNIETRPLTDAEQRAYAGITELMEVEQGRFEKNDVESLHAGEYAKFAIDCLNLSVVKVPESVSLFGAAWTMVRKDAALALLSSLRGHRVQGAMMIRHMLETAVIAYYVLGHPNQYVEIAREEADLLKNQTYRWLAVHFPTTSDDIKEFKGSINRLDSHSNTDNFTFLENFYESDQPWSGLFADKLDLDMTMASLLDVAASVAMVLNGLMEVSEAFPALTLHGELETWVAQISDPIDGIRAALVEKSNVATRQHFNLPESHIFPWQRAAVGWE